MPQSQREKYPFYEHLSEARSRLLVSCLILVLGTILGYFLFEEILVFLQKPLDQPLYYSSPAGALDLALKISFLFGFLVSVPVFLYQVIKFVEPTLSRKVKTLLPSVLSASFLLLLVGMGFAYYVSLPAALYFLNTFSTGSIQSLISTDEYFSFISRYLVGFGVLFQLPLVLVVINEIQKIPVKKLMSYQRWVVIGSFVIAAVLTPTADLFNQLIMAVPLILLYQLSILVVAWINNKKK